VLAIAEEQHAYALEVQAKMEEQGIRTEADLRNEKIGYRIREAQLQKIPYMLVVGEREAQQGMVAVRARKEGDLGAQKLEEIVGRIKNEIDHRLH